MSLWSQIGSDANDFVEAPHADDLVQFRALSSGTALSDMSTLNVECYDLEHNYDLSQSYLELSCRITENDPAYATAGFTTDVLATGAIAESVMSLFRRAELDIHNVKVEAINDPRFAQLIKVLEDCSETAIKPSRSYPNGYAFRPEGDNLKTGATDVSYTARELQHLNAGGTAATRQRTVKFWVPLTTVFGYLSKPRYTKGLNMGITLIRESNFRVFLESDQATSVCGKVLISEMSVWVSRVKASPIMEAAMFKQLSSGKEGVHLFDSYNTYSKTLDGADANPSVVVQLSSAKPKKVFVGLQLDARYTGTVEGPNASNFDQLGLTTAEIVVNGETMPVNALRITSWDGQGYARAWAEFNRATRGGLSCDDSVMDPVAYAANYPLIAFDLSDRMAAKAFDRAVNQLEVRCAITAPAAAYRMVVITCSQKEVKEVASDGRIGLQVV